MRRAGYVLVGGRSSRMGRDKALLPYANQTLAQHGAGAVAKAAGSAILIGDPALYGHLGYPVVADLTAAKGPLGGIVTALASTDAEWNLITACDMPNIHEDFLRPLFDTAESIGAGIDCIVPELNGAAEPLCAIYHRGALAALQAALESNILKMRTVIGHLRTHFWKTTESHWFENVNTPGDWSAHE